MPDDFASNFVVNPDLHWLTADMLSSLRKLARVRQWRLPVLEVDEVFHRALLRWAVPLPPQTEPLSQHQLNVFSLVCRNVLIDELRQRTRHRKLAETLSEAAETSFPSPETNVVNQDFFEFTMGLLDDRQRQVFQMRYRHGLPFSEIAREVGLKEAAVRQMHKRALQKLRDLLK